MKNLDKSNWQAQVWGSGSAPHPSGSQFLAHPSPFFLTTPTLEETLGDEKREGRKNNEL